MMGEHELHKQWHEMAEKIRNYSNDINIGFNEQRISDDGCEIKLSDTDYYEYPYGGVLLKYNEDGTLDIVIGDLDCRGGQVTLHTKLEDIAIKK